SSSFTTVASTLSRGRPGSARCRATAAANARYRAAEREHPAVLDLVAHLSPALVIAILSAAARIAADRLQVAVGIGADPHVGPRRRDGEPLDAAQHVEAPDGPAGAAYRMRRPERRRTMPGARSVT